MVGKWDFGVANGHERRYSPKIMGESVKNGRITALVSVRILIGDNSTE